MMHEEASISPAELLREMRAWFPRIERGAAVDLVLKHDALGFTLSAARADNGRPVHAKTFTPASIAAFPRRPCDHARDFLRECLVRRGAA
jgi:hypothetical protein